MEIVGLARKVTLLGTFTGRDRQNRMELGWQSILGLQERCEHRLRKGLPGWTLNDNRGRQYPIVTTQVRVRNVLVLVWARGSAPLGWAKVIRTPIERLSVFTKVYCARGNPYVLCPIRLILVSFVKGFMASLINLPQVPTYRLFLAPWNLVVGTTPGSPLVVL